MIQYNSIWKYSTPMEMVEYKSDMELTKNSLYSNEQHYKGTTSFQKLFLKTAAVLLQCFAHTLCNIRRDSILQQSREYFRQSPI